MAPPPSKERAHKEALVKYLEDETLMDWRYFDDLHSPGDEPKGGVSLLTLQPAQGKYTSGLASTYRMVVQPRIMVAGTNESVVQDNLLDYVRWVDGILQKLALHGITGTYSTVDIRKALQGIRLTERGVFFDIQRSADNTGDVAISGRAYMEYEFSIEV